MKINIGKYTDFIGPYQIAEKILFWKDKDDGDTVHNFGTWLAGGEGKESALMKVCTWIESKRKRKVEIRIDKCDTWNMDTTLAMIVLPMLKQLKETKHGSAMVELEDLPEHLRTTGRDESWQFCLDLGDGEEYEKESWNLYEKRWNWVMDEMIWAFEQLQPDYDWEDQYWITHPKIDWMKYPEDEGKTIIPVRWLVEGECDWDGRIAHEKRISNGLRLFGVYYLGLWD